MLGVILCGGQSSRMKDDKGLLLFNSETWAQLASRKLSSLNLQTVFSIRQEQLQSYNSIFSEDQLIIDQASLNLAGPLLGILSVHVRFPKEDLVVLACDLPNLQPFVVKELVDQFQKNKECEAITFKLNGRVEPLCGIYTAKGLAKIRVLQQEKKLNQFSMIHALETVETEYLQALEDWDFFFKNLNSPDDLNGLMVK